MKKEIASIIVCMLMLVTVTSVTGAMNYKTYNVCLEPKASGIVWEDDFDSYETDQFLNGDPEDGGWEGWDNVPSVGSYVRDNESRSSPHSLEVNENDDVIHQFSGVSSGNVTVTAWMFIPEDYVGDTSFILLNTYSHLGTKHWSTQIKFLSNESKVISDFDANELPLIQGEWVEIRVEIDFEADIQQIYYGGDLLVEKSWTEGVSGPGGVKNLACMDLYSGEALSTSVYYDDISIDQEAGADPDLNCEGSLSWVNVSTGETLTGSFTVENVGGAGTLLDWEITDWPSWGTWEFDPESGDDLTPEDGPITVEVTCIAPKDKNEEFKGKIVIENLENSDDECSIDISLTTPKGKSMFVFQILERIIHRFPLLERVFYTYLQ